MPNYRRTHLRGHPVFVTVVTYRRRSWLADPGHVSLLLDSMRRVKGRDRFRHLAHVVMPDHVHWMFEARDGDFSAVVAAVKRDVTWRMKEGGNGFPPYWQSRFYDHVIRDEPDLQRHLDYIHFNPVKHGVASSPADYPHSSFAEWSRRGRYEADWGRAEPTRITGMNPE